MKGAFTRAAVTSACLAAAVPLALAFAGVVPALRFVRERIDITVTACRIDVDGLYVYRNPWPVAWSQGLRVPFPFSPHQLLPSSVDVVDGRTGDPLRVLWIGGEPRFSVEVPAHGESFVRVRFSQRVLQGRAAYLLTTTRPWGRPLDHGEYALHARGVSMVDSSFPLSFARRSFMPAADWHFAWGVAEGACATGS
jgi:hypothetical protein